MSIDPPLGIVAVADAKAGKEFQTKKVVPIAAGRSRVLVLIDGVPYCGFDSRETAEEAVGIWLGRLDGMGRALPEPHQVHWPALEGRSVSVAWR